MALRKYTYTCQRSKRGFTLLEVLVVLALLGILFGVLFYAFSSSINTSTNLIRDSEKLKDTALLLWNIKRKILSAQKIYLEKDKLFMITSAGDYYEGVIKCAYIYKNRILYYYEFPYPYGDIRFYEEDKLIKLGRYESLSFGVYEDGKLLDSFLGLPKMVYIKLEDKELFIRNTP